jgi:F-type H+-transporting ATPase subunit delta
MGQSRIPVRYAKAFFTLAKEKNMLDVFRKDMDFVTASCKIDTFKAMLESPVISTSKKEAIFSEIFKPFVNEKTVAFLNLILKNKREVYLPDVARDFDELYRAEKNIKTVIFTTATVIDDTLRKHVVTIVKKYYNAEIELNEKISKEIVGGFILQVDDQRYDASIASKLKDMERTLTKK